MKDSEKAPEKKREPTEFERFRELTKRIIAVTKTDLPKAKKKRKG